MNDYLEKLFNSFCCADLMPVFSNYKKVGLRNKEITESMGCLNASQKYSGFDPKDPEVNVYVIGDGKRPRTGLIHAFFTSWNVTSIDPELDLSWWEKFYEFKRQEGLTPKRITLIKDKIENVNIDPSPKQLVVLPHSHASLPNVLLKVPFECNIIHLPCCVPFPDKLKSQTAVDQYDYMSYMDFNIMSEKRTFHIWKNLSHSRYQFLIARVVKS